MGKRKVNHGDKVGDIVFLTLPVMRELPFVLVCTHCDCEGPDTKPQARQDGWGDIEYTPFASSWNDTGLCPACAADDAE